MVSSCSCATADSIPASFICREKKMHWCELSGVREVKTLLKCHHLTWAQTHLTDWHSGLRCWGFQSPSLVFSGRLYTRMFQCQQSSCSSVSLRNPHSACGYRSGLPGPYKTDPGRLDQVGHHDSAARILSGHVWTTAWRGLPYFQEHYMAEWPAGQVNIWCFCSLKDKRNKTEV